MNGTLCECLKSNYALVFCFALESIIIFLSFSIILVVLELEFQFLGVFLRGILMIGSFLTRIKAFFPFEISISTLFCSYKETILTIVLHNMYLYRLQQRFFTGWFRQKVTGKTLDLALKFSLIFQFSPGSSSRLTFPFPY